MDEMTIYVPQSPEQFAEALELASAAELIIGKHSISVTQSPLFNSVTALWLMTKKDTLVSIETFNDAISGIENVEALQTLSNRGKAVGYYGIAVDKETGKRYKMDTTEFQEIVKEKGLFNFDRFYAGRLLFSSTLPADFSFERGKIRIIRGILVDGDMNETKAIVQALVNDYGNNTAAQFISDATKIATIFNETMGLTVGIDDITAKDVKISLEVLQKLAEKAKIDYKNMNRRQLIQALEKNKIEIPVEKSLGEKIDDIWNKTVSSLEALGGEKEDLDEEEKRKDQILKIFDDFNNITARLADEYMRPTSSLMSMYLSKAKGSLTNAQRIFASTSAQLYRGGLIETNLSAGRSSIYTPRNSSNPEAYGLSRNSFLQGFTPIGYLAHSIAGREGLVDTQSGTSEAGTAYQALIKSLENWKVSIFGDVRDHLNNILSFALPFNPQDMQQVKIENRDVLSFVDIGRLALRVNLNHGYGKNGEKMPSEIPVEQQRLLKLSKPDVTKLIDMSRKTETIITIKDKNGNVYREVVSYYEPISEIKERIVKKYKVDGFLLNLVYKGISLEDNKFLSDYIKVATNEDVLYMASHQGTVVLQTDLNRRNWFQEGSNNEDNQMSYVDKEGNVRRVITITPMRQKFN